MLPGEMVFAVTYQPGPSFVIRFGVMLSNSRLHQPALSFWGVMLSRRRGCAFIVRRRLVMASC